MKKQLFFFLLFLFLFMIGCSKPKQETNVPTGEKTPESKSEAKTEDENPLDEIIKSSYEVNSGAKFVAPKEIDEETIKYSSKSDLVEINGCDFLFKQKVDGKVVVTASWKEFTKEIEFSVKKNDPLKIKNNEIEANAGDEFVINYEFNKDECEVTWKFDNSLFTLEKEEKGIATFKSLKVTTSVIIAHTEFADYEINITVQENYDFTIDDFSVFIGEEVDLPINIISGDASAVTLSSKDSVIEIKDLKIKGISEGVASLEVSMGSKKQVIEVNVKDLDIEVLNETLDVDYFETLELKVVYPEFLNDNLIFTVSDETVLTVENGVCIPSRIGKTRIKISLENHEEISKSIIVNVTVDPVAIMKSMLLDEVLMMKSIKTYGATIMEQKLMGSVSKYYFGPLNLIEKIVPLTSEEYAGQVATEELLAALDEKGLVRSGIKHTETKYITYHDTANNTATADAQSHWTYMIGDYNRTTRARSWHYTVDDKCIIQNIPDDEVTWQGDHYIAYSQSIGIETCINYGCNLDIIWHRMGKLCAKLMEKFHMDMSSIKQHYDWNRKECPHTLRANNLYSYALDMIEAEWIVAKCLSGYTIKFESLTPDYLDDTGQIKRAPEVDTLVSFRITITNAKGYNESFESSVLVKPLS